ncbi:DEAD/DEAH box helicase [Flaviflagellibacter deserti]|uniref:DEAD/DEAH box helicase n=1 Tax=Flaviflagellibacter deserti TaxID=2267266 RepID=A0ABV9Z7F3_9HYPH
MAFPSTHPSLARALAEREYIEATPVQSAVLADNAADRDLLVSAQTGSGKTVAYGLAIGGTLLGEAERLDFATLPVALIVAPTRELALQVHRELEWLYKPAGGRIVACVGGMDPKVERRKLQSGAHIVVGTPGRLRDHIERGGLDVSQLRAVVLDEADEMLDMGFREDLEFILETTPRERRTLLFSATMPRSIETMAKRYQRDAMRIEVKGDSGGHADIEYRAVRIVPNEIEHAVVNLLRFFEAPSAIIFCNTRNAVRHLQTTLLERGFSVVALSGELSQNDRNHALQALRDGRARVCVATDVAARGIDLPNLSLVIHAELPSDPEVLQHRSGRTGRAGKKGTSVLLVPLSRRRKAEGLMASARVVPVWSGPPTAEEILELDQQRLMQDPMLQEAPAEEDIAMAQTLLVSRSAEEIAAALVRVWRSQLPAAEEVFDPGDRRDSRDPRQERAPQEARPQREPFANGAWFHMRIGRRENADPKWLLPMLCRRGNVTRQEIGAIRIFERETKFEVAASAADRFAHAVRKADGDIEIVPLRDGGAAAPTERPAKQGPRPKREEHARTDRPARPPRKDFKPGERKEFQPKPAKKKRRPPPAR